MTSSQHATRAEAVAVWNTRAESPSEDDDAAALLAALAQALGFCVATIARGDAAQIDRLLTAAEHRAAEAAAQTAKDAQA